MAVAKKIGYFKPYTPNSKADQKRNKPFIGTQKKGTEKKCNVRDVKPTVCLAQIPDQMAKP